MAQNSLLLVYALVRSLSHKLRTPLSVISNNFSYLTSLTDDSACNQGLSKCQEISDILKSSILDSPNLQFQETDLVALFLNINSTLASPIPKQRLLCDPSKIRTALAIITQLIGCNTNPNSAASRVEVVTLPNCLKINLTSNTQTLLSASSPQSFESLTEFFCLTLDRDSPSAPIADAILWAHKYSIKVVQDVELRVEISIPYERQ